MVTVPRQSEQEAPAGKRGTACWDHHPKPKSSLWNKEPTQSSEKATLGLHQGHRTAASNQKARRAPPVCAADAALCSRDFGSLTP